MPAFQFVLLLASLRILHAEKRPGKPAQTKPQASGQIFCNPQRRPVQKGCHERIGLFNEEVCN